MRKMFSAMKTFFHPKRTFPVALSTASIFYRGLYFTRPQLETLFRDGPPPKPPPHPLGYICAQCISFIGFREGDGLKLELLVSPQMREKLSEEGAGWAENPLNQTHLEIDPISKFFLYTYEEHRCTKSKK